MKSSYVAGFRFVFLSLTLLALIQVPSLGQEVSAQAPRIRVIDYSGDLLSLVAKLPKSFDVTIGFEVDSRQPQSYVRLAITNPTIDDVIAAIVRTNPNYTWRRHESTIEILPDNNPTPFLDAQVNSFHVKDVTAEEAVRELLKLNDVQSTLAQAGLRLAPLIDNSASSSSKISLDLVDVSFRQVLNKIAAANGLQFWVLRRIGSRNEFFSISFK
jgi:hypothetical protein